MTTPSRPRRPAVDTLEPEVRPSRLPRYMWQGRFLPAFWTVASAISLLVNVILIIIVLALVTQLFTIRELVGEQLIGGLYDNFVKMDQASIRTTIQVNDVITVKDTVPVIFDLPLQKETTVVLTKDAYIKRATVFLNGAAVPTDIILRQGTTLDIYLDMNVAVNQTLPIEIQVPVTLNVPVDIPLSMTDLHVPFSGLQNVVKPYKELIDETPTSWTDALCPDWLCAPTP